jgi:hypothetical protein
MKNLPVSALIALAVLILPSMSIHAQTGQPTEGKPPIAQPLIREGDLAEKLVDSLKLGPAAGETEAESKLGDAGIAPRNGWIADYPVTPDIVGELRKSISDAAEANRISMGKDEALRALDSVMTELNLAVKSGAPPTQASQSSPTYDDSGNTTVINNYYAEQGPPVVTYYAPPPDYLYLYTWFPYPFWWWNVWFPGYYILVDFHRVVHVHHRVEIISNHFVDRRANKVYRIDPKRRYNGRTYGGVGVPHHSKRYMITGPRTGNDTVFRGSREREMRARERTVTQSPGRGRDGGPSSGSREGRVFTPSPGGREGGYQGGGRDGRVFTPSPGGGRDSGPSGGGRGEGGGRHGGDRMR